MLSDRFGENLRSWRELRSFSREELAQRADCSSAHVRKMEAGKTCPTIDMVERLAGALGVPMFRLLGEEPADTEASRVLNELREAMEKARRFFPQGDECRLVGVAS